MAQERGQACLLWGLPLVSEILDNRRAAPVDQSGHARASVRDRFNTDFSGGLIVIFENQHDFDATPRDVASLDALTESERGLMDRNHLERCHDMGGSETAAPGTEAPFVSMEAEIPEVLYRGMKDFIGAHPTWDQYQVMSSALAHFLFQNGCDDRAVTERYLDDLFNRCDG